MCGWVGLKEVGVEGSFVPLKGEGRRKKLAGRLSLKSVIGSQTGLPVPKDADLRSSWLIYIPCFRSGI